MDLALAIGRLLLIGIFLFSGVGKIADLGATAGQIAGKGLPAPMLLATIAAVSEIICGILVVVGWQTRLAALGMAAFTAIAGYFFHDFWNLPAGPEQRMQMIHAMKNASIIGGLLVLAAAGPGRFSIEGRRSAALPPRE